MTNRLATAAAWLAGVRQRHASSPMVYRDEAGGLGVELDGTRGQTVFRESAVAVNGGGRVIRAADFLFDPDQFRTKVGRWPVEGDTVTAPPENPTVGVAAVVWRVTGVNSEPAYRIDPQTSQLRVHTHEAEELAAA